MFSRLRTLPLLRTLAGGRRSTAGAVGGPGGAGIAGTAGTGRAGSPRRRHNIFEAAAAHVAACSEDDEDAMDEAAGWVSPEALSFGVRELACRAVIALARERGESPQAVARSLLGLPAA